MPGWIIYARHPKGCMIWPLMCHGCQVGRIKAACHPCFFHNLYCRICFLRAKCHSKYSVCIFSLCSHVPYKIVSMVIPMLLMGILRATQGHKASSWHIWNWGWVGWLQGPLGYSATPPSPAIPAPKDGEALGPSFSCRHLWRKGSGPQLPLASGSRHYRQKTSVKLTSAWGQARLNHFATDLEAEP